MAEDPAFGAEAAPPPAPWWYSARPRFTLVVGLAVVTIALLRLVNGDLNVVAALLGLCGVFQLVVGVASVRRDARERQA